MNIDRLASLGVPARVVRALRAPGFDSNTPAVDLVARWWATRGSILVMCGACGTGKSVAAAFALASTERMRLQRMINHPPIEMREVLSSRWVAAEDLAKASDFGPAAEAFWPPLRQVHLLVIDELDPRWMNRGGRGPENFLSLLRRRFEADLRTIVTTNLSPVEWNREFGAADGGRLRDRLREAELEFGESPLAVVKGSSLRGREA